MSTANAKGLPDIGGYEIVKYISRGATGVVYQAKKDDKYYALKEIPSKRRHSFLAEVENLKRVKGTKNVIEYVDSFSPTIFKYYIVMEYFDGDLLDKFYLSPSQTYSVVITLFSTVIDLHNKGLIHADLKPRNILYNKDRDELRIIDFESMCEKGSKCLRVNTPLYQPPEIINLFSLTKELQTQFIDDYDMRLMDNYALAVTVYMLLTKEWPFEGIHSQDDAKNPELRRSIKPPKYDDTFDYILSSMLSFNMDDRMSLEIARDRLEEAAFYI